MIPIKSEKKDQREEGGASGAVGARWAWGSGTGVRWEGFDRKRNYGEAEISKRNDGKTEASIEGGRKSNDKKN